MTSERNPEGGFVNQKKKNRKSVPTETAEKVSSIRKWKKAQPLSSVTQC